jgi:hypothetical protein
MLLGELDIGVGDVKEKLGSVDSAATGLMAGFGKLGAAAAVVTAGLAALAGVAVALGDVLDFGGALNDMSLATGESAGNLVILGQAFENAGLGAEATGDFLHKLQDSIAGVNAESGAAADALARMGLSADGLRTKDSLQQIEALQEGFAKLDQTSKVAAARDLFGKSGGKALALLNDPGALSQAKEQASPLAMTMEANRAAFDALGDALNGVALSAREFFAGFLEPLAPFFTSVAESLGSVDFTAIGRALGNIASGIVWVFGALWEGFKSLVAVVDKFTGGALSKTGEVLGNIGAAIAGKPKESEPTNRLGRLLGESGSGASETQVSALQRVGGGGRFGGGDAYLTESQRQTTLLQQISDKLGGAPGYTPVPV